MRERLTNHGLGEHGREHEGVAVQDAVAECRSGRGTADVGGVVVDDAIWAVVDLPAQPIQRAELPGLVEEMRVLSRRCGLEGVTGPAVITFMTSLEGCDCTMRDQRTCRSPKRRFPVSDRDYPSLDRSIGHAARTVGRLPVVVRVAFIGRRGPRT